MKKNQPAKNNTNRPDMPSKTALWQNFPLSLGVVAMLIVATAGVLVSMTPDLVRNDRSVSELYR